MDADSPPVRLEHLLIHATWVRELATRLVRDADLAEDLVQETWLAALRTPPHEQTNLRGWLARVVRNAARSHGRSGARRVARETAVAREREDAPSSDELSEEVETQRRLAAHVLELDEPFRHTVLLRYWEGLSSTEIARRTGVPAGTVRWRLKRGLDELRERLDDGYGSRHAWCLALAPFVRRDALLTSGAAGGVSAGLASLVQGILAMNLAFKLLLLGAAVSALALLTPLGGLAVGLVAEPPLEIAYAKVTFRPVEEAARTREQVMASQRVPVAAPAAAVEPVRNGVAVTVLDSEGRAVPDAALWIQGNRDVETRTGADGTGIVALPASWNFRSRDHATLCAEVPGFLVGWRRFAPVGEEIVDAGALILAPAGVVEGVVLDANGVPIAGAWVEAGEAPIDERKLRDDQVDRTARGHGDARTDAAGRFRLERVPVGKNVLWAMAEGHLASPSGRVEVRAHQVSSGVVIELGVVDPDDFIRGIVLDPEGAPVPGAHVELSYRSSRGSGSFGSQTDEEGRFLAGWTPRVPHVVVVQDPGGRLAPLRREGIEGSASELVLQFGEPEWLSVEVVGPDGPILAPQVIVWDEDHRQALVSAARVRVDGARARFAIPDGAFLVEVAAAGHERVSIGPIQGLAGPRELRVELESLPGIHGRVLVGDRALAGAHVSLHRAAEGKLTTNGFPALFGRKEQAVAESDGEGRFALDLHESGTFYLRAEADGHAPGELGPLRLDEHRGRSGLELVLDRGGTIEGRVLTDGLAGVSGSIVAISRGDGHPRTGVVGVDRAFRFERLTPGPWLVKLVQEEIVSDSYSSTSTQGRPFERGELESNCLVVEGEVTLIDLEAPSELVRLVGHFLLDGQRPAGWTAQLVGEPRSGRRTRHDDESTPHELEVDGSFELVAPRPGVYRLTLHAPGAAEGRGPILSMEVELWPGTNTWSRSFPSGTVRVENPEPLSATGMPLAFVRARIDGVDLLAPVIPDEEGGPATLPCLPAGPAHLVRFTLAELATLDAFPVDAPGLVPFRIVADETTHVRLP